MHEAFSVIKLVTLGKHIYLRIGGYNDEFSYFTNLYNDRINYYTLYKQRIRYFTNIIE